ncbi:MAG: hypothetical protein IJE43_19120 [Alphaproteobacteria bacterium]|nr:hypothetical protein [Alphaproteobacteria bacterium]
MCFNNEFYAKLNESIYRELVQVKNIEYIEENSSAFMVLRCANGNSEYSLRYCLDNILTRKILSTEFTSVIDEVIQGLEVEIKNVSDLDITSDIMDFNRIKYRLAFTVTSKNNLNILQDIPHLEYLDMYVYFYVLVNKCKDKIVRVDVSTRMLKVWGVDINKVMYHAVQNMGRLLPLSFTVMQSDTEFESEFLALGVSPKHRSNIYVLSNQYKVHGMSSLLYPDALKSIAERLNDDLIIVPVSIHLCFVLEARYYEDYSVYEQLSNLMETIKLLESKDEYVSDNVYIYEKSINKLSIKGRFYEKKDC